MAREKQRVMVKIGSGQSFILPGGAKILSLTEVDGGSADSLCIQFPPNTPLTSYTFFTERRVYSENFFIEGLDGFIVGFGYDDGEETRWITEESLKQYALAGPFNPLNPESYGLYDISNELRANSFTQRIKTSDGVVAAYVCSECNGSSNCNNTITITIPSSYGLPYFVVLNEVEDAKPYFFRLYPIDPNFPGQYPREACTERV